MDLDTALFVSYVGLLLACAATDILWLRIPNYLVLLIAGLFVLATILTDREIFLLAQVGPALGLFAVGLALFALGKVGGGDVKFLGAAALWVGMGQIGNFLLWLAIAGAAVALAFLLGGLALQWSFYRAREITGRNIFIPESIAQRGQVPYGVSITIASLLVAGDLPFFR